MQEIKYLIPITGIKVSTNKIYAGIHWTKRKNIKDGISGYAAAFCRPVQEVESYPVEICYRFLFRKKPLDTLNTAFMSKCFEDSMVSLGIIKDDTPKYVGKAILEVPILTAEEREEEVRSFGPEVSSKDQEDYLIISINKLK